MGVQNEYIYNAFSTVKMTGRKLQNKNNVWRNN